MGEFSLADFVPYLLNQAAEQTSLDFSSIYRGRYNMRRTEWRALFHLGHFGAMTATDIARMSKMHKTKISRAIKELEEKRYVRREQVSNDRRSELLSLLPAGQRAFNDLYSIAERHNAQLLSQFSPGEKLILLDCLQRLSKLDLAPPDQSLM
ncbi:MarR family winged helix-turn-helix transcriptional regulator [Yoonia sediminilitoris]|uniref:MarR family transcriptional regulator n=1 Tax=Yoonia sediminilitoris TaxID=1286148 RepID=A0A2T6KC03_9RHOB|nr:MarR family transcriptional regulator [Yoonia sediminilitoris]PUB12403.1 MarR family transcriptional regulator [Yoonia sediminilitoris]RCW93097.1 DNA-binding MarR family transcriptional regulator [Yoonia sediminilitoris]